MRGPAPGVRASLAALGLVLAACGADHTMALPTPAAPEVSPPRATSPTPATSATPAVSPASATSATRAAPPSVEDALAATARCDRYQARLAELSGEPAAAPGDWRACESLTAEQQHCGADATSLDDFGLCTQFPDTPRRELARSLLPSIRRDWPGNAPVMDVITSRAAGCGLFVIFGARDAPLGPNDVTVGFALGRGALGGVTDVLASFTRKGSDATWTCVYAEPVSCQELTAACAAGR